MLGRAPAATPALVALPRGAAAPQALAIDGSSVILAQSGSILLTAHRAAAVGPGRAPRVTPARVHVLDARDASIPVAEALARVGAPPCPPGILPGEAALHALRQLAEHALALDLVETLDRGAVLLLDGALQMRPPVLLLDRVLERAAARGVDVVGVCKSTNLLVGDAPALAACLVAARAFPSPTWSAEVAAPPNVRGRTFLARLSSAEPRAFRFDVAASDGDPQRVLSGLAALAGHPGYPGYPSPLAMAHHAAVLTDDDRRALLAEVEDESRARGLREDAWRAAFVDYHDVLELGV